MVRQHPRGAPAAAPETALRMVLLAVVTFVALALAVSEQRYLPGETAVLEAVNEVPTPLGWPLRVVMQLGTVVAGIALCVAVWVWSRAAAPAVAVLVATAVAFRLDNVVKDMIDRPRPPAVVDGLEVRESIHGFGFPSGHTTLAFALAGALHGILPPRWRGLPWALAAVVGLARVHVAVHWPADVLGGAALGTAIGLSAWAVAATVARRRPGRSSHAAP